MAEVGSFTLKDGGRHDFEAVAGIEFVVVTRWDSMDALAKFAGRDPEAAVVPAKAADMMIEFDRRARHYEVIE